MRAAPDAILLVANRELVGWRQGADAYVSLDAAALAWLDGADMLAPSEIAVLRLATPRGASLDFDPLPLPNRAPWPAGCGLAALEERHAVGDRLALFPWHAAWHLWSAELPRAPLPQGFLPLLARFVGGDIPARVAEHWTDPAQARAILAGMIADGALVGEAEWQARSNELLARARSEGGLISADSSGPALAAIEVTCPAEPRGRRVPAYFLQSAMSRSSIWHPDGAQAKWGRSNYLPLALGMILAQLKAADGGALAAEYHFVERFVTDVDALEEAIITHGPGIALFSDYEWNVDANLLMSEALKEADQTFLCVHGGPSAPKYEAACAQFMAAHPHVDVVVRGEGEETARALLSALAGTWPVRSLAPLEEVAGLTFRSDDGQPIRTPDRPRITDLDALPSPYLSGVFDGLRAEGTLMAVVETNRGCPYSCTFCDWGSAIQSKIRRFDLQRVKDEITWIARRGFRGIWCADANFGILERDQEIAEHIVRCKADFGAPRQFFVNYAKNSTSRVAQIVDTLLTDGIMSDCVIAIQSVDKDVLSRIKRSNIPTHSMLELLAEFRSRRVPVSTDLMLALPGSSPDKFRRDLQTFFDLGVPAKAYMTRVLPNSPMAAPEYTALHNIETDDQGFIRAAAGFEVAERNRMIQMFRVYRALLGAYGIVRYVAAFAQNDYGIPALDQIDALSEPGSDSVSRCSTLLWAAECLHGHRVCLGDWARPILEFQDHLDRAFGVPRDSAMETAMRAQRAVLPQPGRRLPQQIELQHDFCAYWKERLAGGTSHLSDYPRGTLRVADPDQLCADDPMRCFHDGNTRLRDWELKSDLSQHKGRRILQVLDAPVLIQGPELGLY